MSSYKYLLCILLASQSALCMKPAKKGLFGNSTMGKVESEETVKELLKLQEKTQAQAKQVEDLEKKVSDDHVSLQELQQRCTQLTDSEQQLRQEHDALNLAHHSLAGSEQQLRQDHNALAILHQNLGNRTAQMVQRVKELEQQENAFKYPSVCKAVKHGHLPSLMILHQNGKSLEKEGKKKYRPLQLAALMGRTVVVRFLLDNGANVHEQGSRGKTAVYLSTRFDHPAARETTQLLLDRGALLNQENVKGRYSTAFSRFLAKGKISGHGNMVTNNSSVVTAVRGLSKVPWNLKTNCPFYKPNQAMVDQLILKEPGITACTQVINEALASKDPVWLGTLIARGFAVDAPTVVNNVLNWGWSCRTMLAPFAQNKAVVDYYNACVIDAVQRRNFKKLIALIGEGTPFDPQIFNTIFYGKNDATNVTCYADQSLFGLLFDILGLQCDFLAQQKAEWANPQYRFLNSQGSTLQEYLTEQGCSQSTLDRYKKYEKTYKPY
ncbi:MAG: ankyrin repeat domain-containing protein [Candidatus Babeliales bacterium]